MSNFKENLSKIIEEQEVVIACMAEDTGISQKALYSYKAGRNEPRFERLLIIADYLGVTIDELIR